eukprot:CAMPEP_0115474566 /NCGR_PEP_ID=MMETSP0271-20121206/54161_1 /TAXON_ID=71861 /ORGANISM="Scrippsiella trochoidea, Strain CCMP3099" /LENGTH=91 /DNA_ID=CAMNT_0002901899 /DNA_START=572 /DNA_END=847 /DNA_ORIENTATION=-
MKECRNILAVLHEFLVLDLTSPLPIQLIEKLRAALLQESSLGLPLLPLLLNTCLILVDDALTDHTGEESIHAEAPEKHKCDNEADEEGVVA